MKTTIWIWGATYTIELGADGDTPDVIIFPTWEKRPDITGLEWLETFPPQLKAWRPAEPGEMVAATRIAYATPAHREAP
jgi:hypothetical protein